MLSVRETGRRRTKGDFFLTFIWVTDRFVRWPRREFSLFVRVEEGGHGWVVCLRDCAFVFVWVSMAGRGRGKVIGRIL